MKITRKHQTIERKNSHDCVVTEYNTQHPDLDFAVVKVTGRYPQIRRAVNQECDEIVYVNDGSGRVVVNDNEYLLNSGDVVLIESGEKFYWDGDMSLHISCRPAFNSEQHQIVD